VAANSLLRRRMKEEADAMGAASDFNLYFPSSHYCTDNAAMIAMAGLAHFEAGRFADRSLCPSPNWELSVPL
jgi:N6-L-threonylcarbamoyladenine synthase